MTNTGSRCVKAVHSRPVPESVPFAFVRGLANSDADLFAGRKPLGQRHPLAIVASLGATACVSGTVLDGVARVVARGGIVGQSLAWAARISSAPFCVRQLAAMSDALGDHQGPWAYPSVLGATLGTLAAPKLAGAVDAGIAMSMFVTLTATTTALLHFGPRPLARDILSAGRQAKYAQQALGLSLRQFLRPGRKLRSSKLIYVGGLGGGVHWFHQWVTVPIFQAVGERLGRSQGALLGLCVGSCVVCLGPSLALAGYLCDESIDIAGDTALGAFAGALAGQLIGIVAPISMLAGLGTAAGAMVGFCLRNNQPANRC